MRQTRNRGGAMNVCLMSIKPKWAKELYSGKKTVEFRKSSPSVGSVVFMYECAPVQRVTGAFVVEAVLSAPAYRVWHQCSSNKDWKPGSVRSDFLFDYAGSSSATCCAILITSPWRFSPAGSVLLEKFAVMPPRSWQHLRANVPTENHLAQALLATLRPMIQKEVPNA